MSRYRRSCQFVGTRRAERRSGAERTSSFGKMRITARDAGLRRAVPAYCALEPFAVAPLGRAKDRHRVPRIPLPGQPPPWARSSPNACENSASRRRASAMSGRSAPAWPPAPRQHGLSPVRASRLRIRCTWQRCQLAPLKCLAVACVSPPWLSETTNITLADHGP